MPSLAASTTVGGEHAGQGVPVGLWALPPLLPAEVKKGNGGNETDSHNVNIIAIQDLDGWTMASGTRRVGVGAEVDEQTEGREGEEEATLRVPLLCNQHWFRKIRAQKEAIKGIVNARKTDCGPKGIHWRWYRDRRIKIRKKKNYI